MTFEWDPVKDVSNRAKHGISFSEAEDLFTGHADYLEIYDAAHSEDEERFWAVGPIRRGIIVVVFTERAEDVVRIISARFATSSEQRLYHQHLEGT